MKPATIVFTFSSILMAGGVHAQLPVPAPIQISEPLTLQKAIKIAVSRQPSLGAATATRQASEARLRQTQSAYQPRVTPTYTFQQLDSTGIVNQILPGGIVQPVQQSRSVTTRQEDLSLSLRLFDTGARDMNARQSRQSLISSELAEANIRQTVIGNVAENFYAALRTQALVDVARSQVERTKNTLDLVTAQIQADVAARKDDLQPRADYLNAQVTLLQAENNAQIALTQLRTAMGIIENIPLELSKVEMPATDRKLTAEVPVQQGLTSPAVIAQIVKKAFETRPDIKQAEMTAEISATTVRIAKISAGVNVTADVAARYQFDAANDPLRSIGNNQQVTLSATYPLFDGGNVRNGVRAAEAQQRSQEYNVQSQRQNVALEVEQAIRNLEQARLSLPATQAALEAAQNAFEKAVESKKEGVGSIVEIITAQTALVQSQTNAVQAIFNYYSADARLARVLGQSERIAQ